MATDDTKAKKRKGAIDAVPKAKKQKKSEEPVPAAKPTKTTKTETGSSESLSTAVKPSRKRAADFFDDASAKKPEGKKAKKSKIPKTAENDVATAGDLAEEIPELEPKPKKGRGKAGKSVSEAVPELEAPIEKAKKSKKAKDQGTPIEKANKEKPSTTDVVPVANDADKPKKANSKQKVDTKEATQDEDVASDAGDGVEDDQTAALLAGFESDNDEADPEEDNDIDTSVDAPIDQKLRKQLGKASKNVQRPGVIYVGRIPHGFFEPQMKAYFKQFGHVKRLRLSRNKKTGASKHYAFVEFASEDVAEIVAKTMDKYLMFGHILQCKVIPTEQVHENLFVGANERFRAMPRNKIAGHAMARGTDREQWEKRVKKENKRRTVTNKKLKEDFDYVYAAPTLKAVDDVPKKTPALENGDAQHMLIEPSPKEDGDKDADETRPAEPDVAPVKKSKKSKKARDDVAVEEQLALETSVATEKQAKMDKDAEAENEAPVSKEKSRKSKRAVVEPTAEPVAPKKNKKAKTAESDGGKVRKTKKSEV